MREETQWKLAWALFEAFRTNLPGWINRARVEEYHSILDRLEQGSGEDLRSFRIPDHELKPKVSSWNYRTGKVTHYDERYCEDSYFARQVDGVWRYCQQLHIREEPEMNQTEESPDYWSMNDQELERLATKYNIPPLSRAGKGGEHWYVDRDRIIDELLKRDEALRSRKKEPTPANVINVGNMHGSSIQQGSQGATSLIDYKSKGADLRNLLEQVKDAVDDLRLSEAARTQLQADVRTVEAQLESPNPKPSIMMESLHSLKTIMENAAGSVIASALLPKILKMLGG